MREHPRLTHCGPPPVSTTTCTRPNADRHVVRDRPLQKLSQRGFREFSVAQDFAEQATSDVFARVDGYNGRSAIRMLQITMAAVTADHFKAAAFQGRDELGPEMLGSRVTTQR